MRQNIEIGPADTSYCLENASKIVINSIYDLRILIGSYMGVMLTQVGLPQQCCSERLRDKLKLSYDHFSAHGLFSV